MYGYNSGTKYGEADPWVYYLRNCTSYVAEKVNQEFSGRNISGYGNAASWATSAEGAGYLLDSSPEVGDIAVWGTEVGGGYGHVAYVYAVSGGVGSLDEYNVAGTGQFTSNRTTASGSAGPADWYVHMGTPTGTGLSQNLSFINQAYYAGDSQLVSYSGSSNYQTVSNNVVTPYPDPSTRGTVFPLYQPNGNLSFVNVDYYTGHAQVVTYSASSNYQTLVSNIVTPYPVSSTNGTIIPRLDSNGNLTFVNLAYYTGYVQEVTYSVASNYQSISSNIVTPYPDPTNVSEVVPLYEPNNDLAFVNLDYYIGNAQVVSYSAAYGYQQISSNYVTAYPSTTSNLIVPLFMSDYDLSFINLDYGGHAQDVTYTASSNFQSMKWNIITAYPATTSPGSIFPRYMP